MKSNKPNNPDKETMDFKELEEPIMRLLAKKKTEHVVGALCEYFYPVWHYYINYYLYINKVYDEHPDYNDIYQELYVNCTEILKKDKVKLDGNNFNRIKRYFNKSISGWVINRLFKKKKKQIEFDYSDMREFKVTVNNDFEHVEYLSDLAKIEKHISGSFDFYFSLVIFNIPDLNTKKDRKKFKEKFRNKIYSGYRETGRLLQPVEALGHFNNAFLYNEETE